MRRILKYVVEVSPTPTKVPAGKIVHVGSQLGEVVVWIEVGVQIEGGADWTNPTVELRVFGTGQHLPEDMRHVGTVQIEGYVWHVYRPMTFSDVVFP